MNFVGSNSALGGATAHVDSITISVKDVVELNYAAFAITELDSFILGLCNDVVTDVGVLDITVGL